MDIAGIIRKFLYFVLAYGALLVCYIMIQELYIEQCTIRGGIMNIFISMPMCIYANRFLEMIGTQFTTMFVSIGGIILAITI